jgi:ComF family protein
VARHATDALLAVLIAPNCVACGGLQPAPLAGPICEACWDGIPLLPPPLCLTCGEPLVSWRTLDVAADRCARCRRTRGFIACARAGGAYDGTLRAAIHALKYDGRRSIARRLGGLMRTHGSLVLSGVDAVVPVPLHRSRLRSRGFNQAADLAWEIGPPVVQALTRLRATVPQADLPSGRRHANVRGAFLARHSMRAWQGATILLVDDVSTTGATLEACARTLLEGGAAEVRALTAARAVRRQP